MGIFVRLPLFVFEICRILRAWMKTGREVSHVTGRQRKRLSCREEPGRDLLSYGSAQISDRLVCRGRPCGRCRLVGIDAGERRRERRDAVTAAYLSRCGLRL